MIARIPAHIFVGAAIANAAFCVATSKAQTSTWEDKANGQGPFLCCMNGVNCSQFFWPNNDLWTQSEVVSCTPPVVRQPSNWTTPSAPNGATYDAVVDASPPVLLLNSTIALASLSIGSGGVVNIQGGTFNLVNDVQNQGFLRCGFPGPSQAGTINAGTSIINDATIAGGTGYITFTADGWNPSVADITNNGLIRGVDGGYLQISNPVIANNGVIEGADDSFVQLGGTLIIGGEFRSGAGNSFVRLLAGSALTGAVVNSGLLSIHATNPLGPPVTIYGDATLTGEGEMLIDTRLAGDPTTDPQDTLDRLINTGNHLIHLAGGGSIQPGIQIINEAVIEGGSGAIDFDSDGWNLASPDIMNTGAIRAVDGGYLQISHAVIVNNGVLEALGDSQLNLGSSLVIGGEFRSDGGMSWIQLLSGAALSGFIVNNAFVVVDTNPLSQATIYGNTVLGGTGRLLLSDNIAGDLNTDPATITDRLTNGVSHTILGSQTIGPGLEFINQGIIEPGTSVGTLTVSGPFTQTASGVLSIELASLTSRDRLVVNGPATLDGTIDVSFLPGFLPALGNQFQILTATSVTGSFSSVVAPPGWHFQASTNSTNVTLQVIAVCGDSTCGPGETPCNCPTDCGAPPSTETDCGNALDEDCDGLIDCVDADCAGDITNCPNGQVPAVSDWGMVILTLLTLTAATLVLMRHRSSAAARTL